MTAKKKPTMTTLYDRDLVAWAECQVQLLREHRWEELDLANLIEEVADLAGRWKDEVKSRLVVLLSHLLKWAYQAKYPRGEGSWLGSITEARRRINELCEDHPSLMSFTQEVYESCYPRALKYAAQDTGIPVEEFPSTCPFTLLEILDEDYLPPRPQG